MTTSLRATDGYCEWKGKATTKYETKEEDNADADTLHLHRYRCNCRATSTQIKSGKRIVRHMHQSWRRCRTTKGRRSTVSRMQPSFVRPATHPFVHNVNFLMIYHIHQVIYVACHSLDFGYRISSIAPRWVYSLCASCDPNPVVSLSHSVATSSSSSCLFIFESMAMPRAKKPTDPWWIAKLQHEMVEERVEVVLLG